MALPAGVYARWVAADLAGTLGDGDPVASWPDSSGNGHDADQADEGNRPSFRASALNAHPAVDFTVNACWLQTAPFSSPIGPATWAGVIQLLQQQGGARVFVSGGGSGADNSVFQTAGDNWAFYAGATVESDTFISDGEPHVFVAVFAGVSSGLYVDGELVASGNVGSSPLSRATLGANPGGANPASILAAELLLYDRALDAGEVGDVTDHLTSTYVGGGGPDRELRVHDMGVRLGAPAPPGTEFRVHGAGVSVTTTPPLKALLIHGAGVTVGPLPRTVGAWWVRVGGQWVRHRAWVRVGGKWV